MQSAQKVVEKTAEQTAEQTQRIWGLLEINE